MDSNANPQNTNKVQRNLSYDDIIDKDLLEILGVKNITAEERKEMYRVMMDTIQNRVIARLDDLIEDKDVPEFKTIVEEKNQEKLEKFLADKNIDLNNLYAQEALIYKVQMIQYATNLEDNHAKQS